jgi:uncharacterized membrane protein YbaN (DUF454 family)
MIRYLWFTLGIILLGIAYAGVILPGIPWTTPTVGAAYCFAKSSPRFHRWIYSHPRFGPFLTNWAEKRVFPERMKYAMLAVMASSLLILWFSTGNVMAIVGSGAFMTLVAIWGWRYPGSVEEYERRAKEGKRVGWLK